MNLSGSFSEVSIQDLLGFLRHGKRTGTLAIRRGEQKATVTLRDGKPLSARMPGVPRLGDLLLASGLSDPITVREAARVQAEEEVRRPLGQILVAFGAVDRPRLESLIQQQLELTLKRLAHWARDGGYTFFAGEPTPDGDLCLDLGEPRRATNSWAAQLQDDREVMLAIAEATLDESSRFGTLAPSQPAALRVHLVSNDSILCQQLTVALPSHLALKLVPQSVLPTESQLNPELHTNIEGPPPVLVVDLRNEDPSTKLNAMADHESSTSRAAAQIEEVTQARYEVLAQLHQRHPEIPIIAIVADGDSLHRALSVGAIAALPSRVLTLTACIENTSALITELWRTRIAQIDHPSSLRSEASEATLFQQPTTAILELMQSISSFAERAILFARAEEGLECAGAFGWSADGRPLAEATRGLRLDLSCAGALAQCLQDGKTRRLSLSPASLPARLAELIGDPTRGEVVIFPIADRNGKIASVLYTDNGELDAPLEGIERLQLASERFAARDA